MNRRDKDRLLIVSVKVAALREQLREAEQEWEELLGQSHPSTEQPPAITALANGSTVNGAPAKLTMVERIIGLLARSPSPLTANDVQNLLNIDNLQTVRTTLARLSRDGRIETPERGRYQPIGGRKSQ